MTLFIVLRWEVINAWNAGRICISAWYRNISSLLTIVYRLFTMSITRRPAAQKRGSSDSGAISRHLSKLSASFNGRKMQIYSGSGEETHRVLIMMATYMDRRAAKAVGDYSWAVFNQLNTGVRVIIYSGIQGMICRTQKNIFRNSLVGLGWKKLILMHRWPSIWKPNSTMSLIFCLYIHLKT